MLIVAVSVAVTLSFATGEAFAPELRGSLIWGALAGWLLVLRRNYVILIGLVIAVFLLPTLPLSPLRIGPDVTLFPTTISAALLALSLAIPLYAILGGVRFGALNRHEFEATIIRMLTGFGYIFFTAIVLIPFYVMVMTSLKSQSELLLNPLDFSLDFSKRINFFVILTRFTFCF